MSVFYEQINDDDDDDDMGVLNRGDMSRVYIR